MNNINNENIWKLMDVYKFEIDPDSIHDDMSCLICKNLMKDACISTCGCRYCFKCINEYIGSSDKYCPGNKLSCNTEYLSLGRDVMKDVRMNNRIFKSQVLCPNDWCNYKTELSQMCEHLRVCSKQCIEVVTNKREIESVMEELRLKEEQMKQQKRETNDEISKLRKEVAANKRETEYVKEELRLKEIQIMEMKEENERQKRNSIDEIINLTKEIMEKVKEMEEGKKEIIKREMAKRKRETDDQRRKTQFCNMDGEMMAKYERMKNKRRRMNDLVAMNELFPIIDEEFVWKIDEISKKKNRVIISESFHSNNYKFCLSLRIYKADIYLNCVIMRGDNDDKVEWPMIRPISMSIINQDTMETYKTETYKYETDENKLAFHRPQNYMNNWSIGGDYLFDTPFIEYSSIKDNRSIIIGKAIIVSCVIG